MKEIDLTKTGPILLRYHNQVVHVCPVRSYRTKGVLGIAHTSNIRIFPLGGGIRSKPTMGPKVPFFLRMTDPDGTPTNYDTRLITTCIELEPQTDLLLSRE